MRSWSIAMTLHVARRAEDGGGVHRDARLAPAADEQAGLEPVHRLAGEAAREHRLDRAVILRHAGGELRAERLIARHAREPGECRVPHDHLPARLATQMSAFACSMRSSR